MILDEILKGTNSTDKAIGSRKFVEKLVGQNATGIIATHDLSLTEIEAELEACGTKFKKLSDDELIEHVATALADEKAVGWMQGRMEFGPRALGGRSIIADPRSPVMQKQLNLKVKYQTKVNNM